MQPGAGDKEHGAKVVAFLRRETDGLAKGSTAEQGQVAYLRGGVSGSEGGLEVHGLDLASGADRLLFDSSQAGGEMISDGGVLMWSPGGTVLAFSGFGAGGSSRLFSVEAATGDWREWQAGQGSFATYFPAGFSPDDGYLAGQGLTGFSPTTYVVFDLAGAGSAPTRELTGDSLAWSPSGHRLALSNRLGVFLVDAATGDYHWLQPEPCEVDW